MRNMPFAGARVLALESRRSKEIAELIRLQGGSPIVAPALMEVPLEANGKAFDFADRLYASEFDMVIFMTGVGARYLHKVLAEQEASEKLIAALRGVTVVARGPKPSAVLREWQVPVAVSVPEPNTWRELLKAVEARPERNLALQEYGRTNEALLEGLRRQGRSVMPVPVYQWQLPNDTEPLAEAIEELLNGHVKAALFTTGAQLEHFLEFAESCGKRDAVAKALRKLFVASIGPTCTEALAAEQIAPVLEPSHPKMGLLVREAAERYGATVLNAIGSI